jgi:diacylglycerol O-acyltransferase
MPVPPVQLTPTDASFLLQEHHGAHFHIGGVAVFDGPVPDRQSIRAHIALRLAEVPRFRQRLASAALGITRPWWVEDPDFNLDYHLRHLALPAPGSDADLEALVGRIFSERLDRTKPLWEMYLVEGLSDGRFALITKVHHALVDGISGVDLASVILDPEPDAGEPDIEPPVPDRRPPPSSVELLARGALKAAAAPAAAAGYAAGAVMYPRRLNRSLRRLGATVATTGSQLLDPAPLVPLNGPIGPHRRFAFRNLSLEQAREIRERGGATVNDVVLALATSALREWLIARGVDVEGLQLRALVPVNLRTRRDRGLLGNRVALVRATLPVDIADPELRLRLVRDAMRETKRSHQLMAARTIIELSQFAPPTILAQASRMNFSTRLFNLLITNVPGPQQSLYLLGRRLRSIAPVAFLPARHRLSIAVFSYAGQLTYGLLADYDHMADLGQIADGVAAAMEDLSRPRERRPRPRRRRAPVGAS